MSKGVPGRATDRELSTSLFINNCEVTYFVFKKRLGQFFVSTYIFSSNPLIRFTSEYIDSL